MAHFLKWEKSTVLTSHIHVHRLKSFLMPPLNNKEKDVCTVTYCTSTGKVQNNEACYQNAKRKYKKIETLIVADCT